MSGGHILPHHVQDGSAKERVFDGAREEKWACVLNKIAHHFRPLALVDEGVGDMKDVFGIDVDERLGVRNFAQFISYCCCRKCRFGCIILVAISILL